MTDVGPVKAHSRGALLQFQRAQQRGQVHGDPVQRAALRLILALDGLDRFPVAGLLFGGFVAALVAKYVRMARHHLVRDVGDHGLKREMPRLFADGCVIDRLQQQIAQFALQLGPVLPLDRVGHFIGFLDGVGRDGLECLFDIPGTTVFRVTQAAHDLQ